MIEIRDECSGCEHCAGPGCYCYYKHAYQVCDDCGHVIDDDYMYVNTKTEEELCESCAEKFAEEQEMTLEEAINAGWFRKEENLMIENYF